MRKLHSRTLIDLPRDEVFQFFCNAENLAVLSPPWINFKILTPLPIEMKSGTLIDYRIRIHGIPVSWKTEITSWNPPHDFTDTQLKGPYSTWIHQHVFEETPEGTLMHDMVDFKSPGWFLEPLVHRLMVRPDLVKIFRFRIAEFNKRFPVLNQQLELDGETVKI